MSQMSTAGVSDLERRLGLSPASFNLNKAAYSIREVLDLIPIGRTKLYQLIAEGKLRPIKFGKRTAIGADDLAALLSSLREAA